MSQAAVVPFQGTNRFAIQRRIGVGAVGVVYEARDREHDRLVALKTLRTPTPESLLSLKHEFRIIQGLRHPNLVSLGELLESDGTWFFTMELLTGAHFGEWVRPLARGRAKSRLGGAVDNDVGATPPDEARLRAALKQLVAGLGAIHAAGKVHRDIKPSNVVVTPGGRLVILDFGVASDFDARQSSDDVVGTVAYMAPEQILGAELGPPTDVYAMGCMLYEALTGRLPFEGSFPEIAEQKMFKLPRPPSALCPQLPADLDALCMEMLRTVPGERPSAAQLAERLGVDASGAAPGVHVALVGRQSERQLLDAAFAHCAEGHGSTVLVSGESGVGKSFLVRSFLDELRARHPDVLALTGRCYERESVPYKALDGVVDQLCQWLTELPARDAAELMPAHADHLARVFPVLAGFVTASTAHTLSPSVQNPRELRARAFAALRELFRRLSRVRTVVLVIDDLQWADGDSFELLHALMHVPDEPPLLLLGTIRVGTERRREGAQASLDIPGVVRRVDLKPLGFDDAAELARELLHKSSGAPPEGEVVKRIVEDAKGHPLFIEELVRSRAANHASGVRKLDDALWERVSRLDSGERRVLELLSVAGRPIMRKTAARAAALDVGQLFDTEAKLRADTLIGMSGAQADSELEPYHDRVRESVIAHLGEDVIAGWHARLASALEQEDRPDPEAIAVHWAGAGQAQRAAHYYVQAAQHAAQTLAFEHAARLYEQALATNTVQGDERRALRLDHAEALANAGRLAAAADIRLELAADTEPVARLALRQRAAQELMCSGHVERGASLLRDAIKSLGIYNPGSRLSLILSVIVARLRLSLRGLEPKRRATAASPDELMWVDAIWAASQGFSLNDNIRGAYFTARGLLVALDANEPDRLARALAIATMNTAAPGPGAARQYAPLLERIRELCRRLGTAEALGYEATAEGFIAFNGGRFKQAAAAFARANALFRDQCVGRSWETSTTHGMLFRSLFYLGDLRELERLCPPVLRQAEQQGDRHMELICQSAVSAMLGVARDSLEAADRAVARSIDLLPPDTTVLQHYWAHGAEVQVALYRGDAGAAYARVTWLLGALKRALLTKVTSVRMVTTSIRARAAVARSFGDAAARTALIQEALRDAAALERELVPWGKPAGLAIRASVAVARGDKGLAMRLFSESAQLYDANDMPLYAAGAERLAGLLRGSDEGAAEVRAADERLRAQGVAEPARMTAMLVAQLP
jgi:hypothetical protein